METERLILRDMDVGDIDEIYDYHNHAICAQYQRGLTTGYDGTAALVDKRKNDALDLKNPAFAAAALKKLNAMIGEIIVMPG